MLRVGIDPRGMFAFFQKLLAEDHGASGGLVSSWFSDHPGTQDRVASVRHMIDQVPRATLDSLQHDSPEIFAFRTSSSRRLWPGRRDLEKFPA